MIDFLNSFGWQLFLIIATVVSFISALIGFITAFNAKRKNKQLQFMLNNVDKSITLEDKESIINEKDIIIKEKDTEISKKNDELNEISLIAKKMALQGIIKNEMESLSQIYTRLRVFQSQLHDLGETSDVDTSLLTEVAKEIEPTYSLSRMQNIFSAIFLFVSVTTTLLSTLLPTGVYKLFSPFILVVQIFIVGRILISGLRSNYTNDELRRLYAKTSLIASAFFLFLAILSTVIFTNFQADDILLIFMIVIAPLAVLHFLLMFLSFHYSKASPYKLSGSFIFGVLIVFIGLFFAFLLWDVTETLVMILIVLIMLVVLLEVVFTVLYLLHLFGKLKKPTFRNIRS